MPYTSAAAAPSGDPGLAVFDVWIWEEYPRQWRLAGRFTLTDVARGMIAEGTAIGEAVTMRVVRVT
jgi:hypothetical protein